MVPHVSDVDAISYVKEIGLNTENASPPTNAYIGRDDRLQVFAASSNPSPFFIVFARLLLPNGTVVPNQWQISPLNGRNGQNFYIDISEGFLLSLTVSGGNAGGPGVTFVRVSLIRGTAVVNALSQTLVAGYVSGFNSLCWPWSVITPSTSGRGNIRSIQGTTPAAGQNINEVVPLNAQWRPISFNFRLTSSAAAGNRLVLLYISDGTNGVLSMPLPDSAAFGPGIPYSFCFADQQNVTNTTFGIKGVPMAQNVFMQPGWSFRTNVAAMDVADQFGFITYVVEEWIIG